MFGVNKMEANKKFKIKNIKNETAKAYTINLQEIDQEGNTPLHIAAREGKLEEVKKLIHYILNINPSLIEAKNNFGSSPLHYATWFGQLPIIKYLMKQGADIKTKDIFDQTLIHSAAWNGDLKLVKFFLEKGFFLEEKDKKGNTPLLSAAQNNHLQVMKFLISKGANIAAQDNNGDNIFIIAIRNANIKIIDFLAMEKNIDLSTIKDKNNNTLLHLAVLHYHDLDDPNDQLKLIKYLFYFRKLDLEVKNNNGDTPLDLAMEIEDNNLVENLLQMGAKIDPVKHESNVRVHQIHQNKPEQLYRYSLKQNEDLLTNPTSAQVNANQKKMKRLKKSHRNFSKPQETLANDAFDMQRLNASLNSLVNTSLFSQNPVQASQTEVSPFNQSSIFEMNVVMNQSNASQGLALAQTLFKMPRTNHSISNQLERRKQEDQIVEFVNHYEFNSTVKP